MYRENNSDAYFIYFYCFLFYLLSIIQITTALEMTSRLVEKT